MKFLFLFFCSLLSYNILLPMASYCQDFYQSGHYRLIRSDPDIPLVAGIDMDQVSLDYLQGFTLHNKYLLGYGCRVHIYTNPMKEKISLNVGVHPSVRDVENSALDYLNGISGSMKEGPMNDVIIGDNMWWCNYQGGLTTILFIRKNVFFIINGKNSERVLNIAKSLDNDIILKASYVIISNTYAPPMIKDIEIIKKSLMMSESTKCTVHVENPGDGSLEFSYTGPIRHDEEDPTDVFTVKGYLVESPGTFEISFWVINEKNALSKISKTQITFSPPPR
jgi:hypothetical protein